MTSSLLSDTLRSIAMNQLRIVALTRDLSRSVNILSANIEHEESWAGIRNQANPAHPPLARNLRAHRDKILATVASLEPLIERPAKAA
jgi:hypothetical protein